MEASYLDIGRSASYANYWDCPRCRWRHTSVRICCQRCGYTDSRGQVQVIDTRMFEMLNHEIRSAHQRLNDIVKPKKDMKTLGNMMKRLLDEDTKTLVKAGFINGDLEMTSAGTSALMAILFDANKAALVKEAQDTIAAEEKK